MNKQLLSGRLVDKSTLIVIDSQEGTDGSVVEFSPATREARVRFPVSAFVFDFFFPIDTISFF